MEIEVLVVIIVVIMHVGIVDWNMRMLVFMNVMDVILIIVEIAPQVQEMYVIYVLIIPEIKNEKLTFFLICNYIFMIPLKYLYLIV